jgi:hypothetical protein
MAKYILNLAFHVMSAEPSYFLDESASNYVTWRIHDADNRWQMTHKGGSWANCMMRIVCEMLADLLLSQFVRKNVNNK